MEPKKKEEPKAQVPAKVEKNIADNVLIRVNQFLELGEIKLPKDYNAGNALKSAWLILDEIKDKDGKPVKESCTKESIANSLFEMVIMGLSAAKRQCSFVPYGNKLICQREWPGTVALAKRYGHVKDVSANVIYESDEFVYSFLPNGRKTVVKHEQDFKNIDDNKIKGAYATITLEDGTTETEIMSIAQIRQAWNQGSMKGNSPAHRNFPGEMAKKTVIYRACKMRINSSDDSVLPQDDDTHDPVLNKSREEISKGANTEEITYEEVKTNGGNGKAPEEITQEGPKEVKQGELSLKGPGF